MTLDEAIKRFETLAESYESYVESINPKELAKCLKELKELREQISEYKWLLKAAVEDLRWVNENTQDAYGTCIMKKCEGCGDCPLDINGDLWCKWKHEAEALALIGEDGDPE